MTDRHTGYEHQIQHAVGQYLKASDGLEMAPMVGNFILIAEIVDPDTGQMMLANVKADMMPIWTEHGMLSLRLRALEANYAALMMGEIMGYGEGYGDEDYEEEK